MRQKKLHHCIDCGLPHYFGQYVVLKDPIWEQTGIGPAYGNTVHIKPNFREVACFFCIEKRLGRQLTLDDLQNTYHCNTQWAIRIWLRACGIADSSIRLLDNDFAVHISTTLK